MRQDTREQFSLITVTLHWFLAIAMIGNITLGSWLAGLGGSPLRSQGMMLHKSIGALVLVFALLRTVWRLHQGFPKPLSVLPRWQIFAAHSAHILLIAGTLIMPLSGFFISIGAGREIVFFGLELYPATGIKHPTLRHWGSEFHEITAVFLQWLIAAHVLAALKHELWDKDGSIQRMLGKSVKKSNA